MVAGPAAADAVRRARAMPTLRVGLHLVAIEGPSVLPPRWPCPRSRIGRLLSGRPAWPGPAIFRVPRARRELAAEIEAQFVAFAATGLRSIMPTRTSTCIFTRWSGRLLIRVGLASRPGGACASPAEPPSVLRSLRRDAAVVGRGAVWLDRLLRWRCRQAGLQVNDHCFGIAWSGRMNSERLLRLVRQLPSESAKSTSIPPFRKRKRCGRNAGISSGGRVGRPA